MLNSILKFFILNLALLNLSSCAYKLGKVDREIPGGFKKVSIPLFENKSYEVGAETYFTKFLIQEMARSKVGIITDVENSDAIIKGQITSINYYPVAKKTSEDSALMPEGTVIATEYRIIVGVNVAVLKRKDSSVLWSGNFSGERTYVAPQVTLAGINSADPLYNLSARRQNLQTMAKDMMAEVYSRISENF